MPIAKVDKPLHEVQSLTAKVDYPLHDVQSLMTRTRTALKNKEYVTFGESQKLRRLLYIYLIVK